VSKLDELKRERLDRANKVLRTIASCGRHFFAYEYKVGQLELDDHNRLWFCDACTNKRIYTAYKGRWKHFTEGGTMRDLVRALCRFVREGTKLHPRVFGPWPQWYCDGDLWGYGDAMVTVRNAAIELEVIEP
jgi:hypothetical protein